MMDKERAKVLITGANGFIGKTLAHYLSTTTEHTLTLAVRSESCDDQLPVKPVIVGDIAANTSWQEALSGCQIVIHTAARVHVLNETEADPLTAFRRVNVAGTLNLARQAVEAGVKRFIFISSIKVNGEATDKKPFAADDKPAPEDAYALSKHEAEQGLQRLAEETGLELVIIRPPLVYGPGVKGNFQTMMAWLKKGIPLPLGAITNQRSFVSVSNLAHLIMICMHHPSAANQIFLVSDGNDLSTTALMRKMSQALGKPIRLIPIPQWLLIISARFVGKKTWSQRLCGSLQIDIGKTKDVLNWQPLLSVDDALRACVSSENAQQIK